MRTVLDYVENKGLDLGSTEIYAAILGESPSKGAKSPTLWNEAFKELSISGVMHPMDVTPGNLALLIRELKRDKRFIGSAVAVPYKMDVIPLLDNLEPEAKAIGAVNCIYRDGEKLVGANTDGAGALWSLQKTFGQLTGNNTLLIGGGGAAFAVAAYVAGALGSKGRLMVANRNKDRAEDIANRINGTCKARVLEWPPSQAIASEVDLLINCTSVGFEPMKTDERGAYWLGFYTPLASTGAEVRVASANQSGKKDYAKKAAAAISGNIARSIAFLSDMKKPAVFDIVYQPRQTMLLNLAGLMGYRTLNGVGMNLEQAVIAFDKARSAAGLRECDTTKVRSIMANVW